MFASDLRLDFDALTSKVSHDISSQRRLQVLQLLGLVVDHGLRRAKLKATRYYQFILLKLCIKRRLNRKESGEMHTPVETMANTPPLIT